MTRGKLRRDSLSLAFIVVAWLLPRWRLEPVGWWLFTRSARSFAMSKRGRQPTLIVGPNEPVHDFKKPYTPACG